jgi:hypothetical protein
MASSLPYLDKINKKIATGNHDAELYVSLSLVIGIFCGLCLLYLFLWPTQMVVNCIVLFITSVVWLPVVAFRFWIFSTVKTRRAEFIKNAKTVLLEIKIPDGGVEASAMEAFFTSMHIGPGESNWYKKYVKGTSRPWFSFEIASFGGHIRYFVWTRIPLRSAIENFMYAQYPGAEVIEVEDYSLLRDPSTSEYKISAFEFKKSKSIGLPIKPLDKYGDTKTDPLNGLLEIMASIPKGEEMWIQYVSRVAKGELWRDGSMNWGKMAKKTAKDYRAAMQGQGKDDFMAPSPLEGEVLQAIEVNASKPAYDVGVRVIYSCPKSQNLLNGMVVPNMFKSFGSEVYNNLSLLPVLGNKTQGFPWEDKKGERAAREFVRGVHMYRRRQFFHPPYRGEWTQMSAGELATLWHIPARSTRLSTIAAKEGIHKSAPDNLPV